MNCRALTLCLFCSIGLHAAPVDLPALFDKRALVKPITELEGILSDGTKATVYKIVVRSLPFDHAMGPWAPATLKDKGGYWEDTVDKKLYRVDADYLRLLNKRGWNMFDADGTVHRTKDRSEFDKVARQELAGWTYDQAAKDGVTNAIIAARTWLGCRSAAEQADRDHLPAEESQGFRQNHPPPPGEVLTSFRAWHQHQRHPFLPPRTSRPYHRFQKYRPARS